MLIHSRNPHDVLNFINLNAETNEPLLPISKHPKSKNKPQRKSKNRKTHVELAKELSKKSKSKQASSNTQDISKSKQRKSKNKNKSVSTKRRRRRKLKSSLDCISDASDSDLSMVSNYHSDESEICVGKRKSLAEQALRPGDMMINGKLVRNRMNEEEEVTYWFTHPQSEHKVVVSSKMKTEDIIYAVVSVNNIDFDGMLSTYNEWLESKGMNTCKRDSMTGANTIVAMKTNVCPYCCDDGVQIGCSFCGQWVHYHCANVDQSVVEWKCDFCVKGIKVCDIE